MYFKTALLCSLIPTQCAGIFLILMSRLDVTVQSRIAGVFSATLATIVFDFVVYIVDMTC